MIRDFLAVQNVAVDAPTALFQMNPTIPVAAIIGADKAPINVQSQIQVEVPLHVWESEEDLDAAIVRVMVHMAEGSNVGVVNYAAINRGLWTKLRFNLKAVILNPAIRGKFFIPERTIAIPSAIVPMDRILCLGPPGKSGTLLEQRNRAGYVLPLQSGVTAIRVYNLS